MKNYKEALETATKLSSFKDVSLRYNVDVDLLNKLVKEFLDISLELYKDEVSRIECYMIGKEFKSYDEREVEFVSRNQKLAGLIQPPLDISLFNDFLYETDDDYRKYIFDSDKFGTSAGEICSKVKEEDIKV